MDCPVCKEAMIVLELDEVEIDYCPGCSGIWLDGGELELLLDDEARARRLLNSFTPEPNSGEAARRCPLCRRPMKKIRAGKPEAPLIDQCPKGEGLWFDRGELSEVIERGSLDRDHKIIRLLAEMFAASSTDKGDPARRDKKSTHGAAEFQADQQV